MRKIWLISAAIVPLLGMQPGGALALDAMAPGIQLVEAGTPDVTADDRILGKTDAPVTIIEYASLTCPHCADFETKTFPKVQKDWIDTGKVRWVFRDFPFDPIALKAHVVAHCGGPDKFYGLIEVFYAQQRNWFRSDADASVAELTKLTKFAGVSDAQVKACLADTKLSTLVVTNRQSGDDAGVDSTPTFFINGSKSTGFKEYDEFQKLLADAS
jgi:protein-disulfide isomerase